MRTLPGIRELSTCCPWFRAIDAVPVQSPVHRHDSGAKICDCGDIVDGSRNGSHGNAVDEDDVFGIETAIVANDQPS